MASSVPLGLHRSGATTGNRRSETSHLTVTMKLFRGLIPNRPSLILDAFHDVASTAVHIVAGIMGPEAAVETDLVQGIVDARSADGLSKLRAIRPTMMMISSRTCATRSSRIHSPCSSRSTLTSAARDTGSSSRSRGPGCTFGPGRTSVPSSSRAV
jgi:hypothetical protein